MTQKLTVMNNFAFNRVEMISQSCLLIHFTKRSKQSHLGSKRQRIISSPKQCFTKTFFNFSQIIQQKSIIFRVQLYFKNSQRIEISKRFYIFRNILMESPHKSNSHDSSFWKLVTRTKSHTSASNYKKNKSQQFNTLQEFSVEISSTFQKKLTVESLSVYVRQLVSQVYEVDSLGIGRMIGEFLVNDISKLRNRITQRLALVKYLVDSLKYKAFGEIQRQILKQWKKNVIFFSINTIWATKMGAHKFKTLQEFKEEYKKQICLIANLTHYYFRDALAILDGDNVATFCALHEDTAHKILNSLRDWEELYKSTLIPLIDRRNFNQKYYMDMNYDPKILQINEQYLDLQSDRVQLTETTQKIKQLAQQTVLHNKIQLLKQVRSTFIKQIEQNRSHIATQKKYKKCSTLQKDDIIGCIIYCIISGQISQIQTCLQSMVELLGPNNELLSRKGVDSYRADLQSAVEYLCQQNQYNFSKIGKVQDQDIKINFSSKSTGLELSISK